jgi:hypothetical protein
MFAFLRALAIATTLGVVRLPAADLPSIEGALAGDFMPTLLPGAPSLHWTVTVQPTKAGEHRVVLAAAGPGTHGRVELTLDPATGNGDWKVIDAGLQASSWSPALAQRLGLGANVAATGEWIVNGQGVLRASKPSGTIAIAWHNGSLGDAEAGWQLDGVTFEGEFAFDVATRSFKSARQATLTVQTITTKRFGARQLRLAAMLRDGDRVALDSASVEIAGGTVTADPAVVLLRPVDVQLDLRLSRIGLQDLVQFVQKVVLDATGRVDGQLHLGWSKATGPTIGAGAFVLSPGETADVTVAPSPGLITSSISPKLNDVLPALLPALKRIEMGEAPLRAQLLDLTITPNGDQEGRTATVHLQGEPTDTNLHAPVDLVVNYRGPLNLLLKFGVATKISYGAR